jgi:hypothetical protein
MGDDLVIVLWETIPLAYREKLNNIYRLTISAKQTELNKNWDVPRNINRAFAVYLDGIMKTHFLSTYVGPSKEAAPLWVRAQGKHKGWPG